MKSQDLKKGNKESESSKKWLFTVSVLSFSLSIVFSYIATTTVNKLPIPISILVLLLVILIGVLFDMISMAVTIAQEKSFHAMASKKLDGARTSIMLIRNAPKVASILSDVIGDICGILSGAIGTIVSLKITSYYNMSFDIQIVISAVIAALTIGGKAKLKFVAQEHSEVIVEKFSKVLSIFMINKKDRS